jgi:hypothetical protein
MRGTKNGRSFKRPGCHPVWVECVLLSYSVPGRDPYVGACPHNNMR